MKKAFTLVELLVVISIMAMLSAFTAMAVQKSMHHAYRANCTSNLRQLFSANQLYAADHGSYVPAARDIFSGNNERWHGKRSGAGQPFDAFKGPLFPYLGSEKGLRHCAAFKDYNENGFEAGCGGYGYNRVGIGSRSYQLGTLEGALLGMMPSAIANPTRTVMFSDTAFPQRSRGGSVLIEYSFAESYFHMADNEPKEIQSQYTDPSIHFRHNQHTGVVWVDGHVTFESVIEHTVYSSSTRDNIGWLGESDNSLFDPH